MLPVVAGHGEEARVRGRFADWPVKEFDARGTVDVLRHGVVNLGVEINLAFFKPAYRLYARTSRAP